MDSSSLMVTPLGEYVDPDSGTFHYPLNMKILQCNRDGVLIHDACIEILKLVWNSSDNRRQVDLRGLPEVVKQGFETFDWGFANAFAKLDGQRYDDNDGIWIPVEDSMWTVMNPDGPFGLQPLITQASSLSPTTRTEAPFSFLFPNRAKRTETAQPSLLSLLPRELQLEILEMLPTSGILNLLLACPEFRQFANGTLPASFWKSRLYFEVPWCADIILSQIGQQRESGRKVEYDRLLRVLDKTSAPDSDLGSSSSTTLMALKNRRRIWRNCERILQHVQSSQV
ncbi:hypothetical protein BJY00DRAFT_221230 [Aspergillus carlsbadensis]|nr:hypothetical protein BJY00DRAFT_221230 [Aspergillus carlsbadensis]